VVSVIVLIAIFSASPLEHILYQPGHRPDNELLNQASVLAEAGNWPGARALTQEALMTGTARKPTLYSPSSIRTTMK
jgi:hypothetical protein